MSREILFKAKRLSDGEWVEGALFDGETHAIIGQNIKFSPYVTNECKIIGDKVDRNTLCQYTGLTDKNGNKIWENDVVHYEDAEADHEGYHDNVFINAGKVCIAPCGVFFTNRQTVDMDDLYLTNNSVDAEIIGNIFDNPELLKGEVEE